MTLFRIILFSALTLSAGERQVSFSPENHNLDNNDNFSRDDRFVCYDTRESVVLGNGASQHIRKLELATGKELTIYAPKPVILDPVDAAPGVIACSYNTAGRRGHLHPRTLRQRSEADRLLRQDQPPRCAHECRRYRQGSASSTCATSRVK